MQPNEPKLPSQFGEPLDTELLLGFAEIDTADIASAMEWWDDTASGPWVGALDNKPIGKKKK
jgi:hypothetical protein